MCGNCDGRMNDMRTRDGTNVDDENDRLVQSIDLFALADIEILRILCYSLVGVVRRFVPL